MDLKKFAWIAAKDVYSLFSDRPLLLIVIVTPLALTFLIAAAFSGLNTGDAPVKNIPVIVVNQDKGAALSTQTVNFGQLLTDTLPKSGDLLSVTTLGDVDAAKAQVTQGKAAAAVLIPPDFSQSLNPLNKGFGDNKVKLTLFRDAASPLDADIVAAVVRQITNGFTNSAIAIDATSKASNNPLFLITQANGIAQDVAAKSSGADAPLTTVSATVSATQSSDSQGSRFDLLQYFAPAMAVFFLNFSMAFGAITLIEERDNGTLQRLLISPTSRLTVLAGKLGGTYINGVLQLAILIIATTLIAPLTGEHNAVWGTNFPALALLTLIVVAASIGLGTLIAAVARNRQQAGVYTSALLVLLGLAGGTFFASSDNNVIARLTVNYWATNAYYTLAQTGDLAAIMPNIGALLLIFVVGFGAGVFLFNRRLDV